MRILTRDAALWCSNKRQLLHDALSANRLVGRLYVYIISPKRVPPTTVCFEARILRIEWGSRAPHFPPLYTVDVDWLMRGDDR